MHSYKFKSKTLLFQNFSLCVLNKPNLFIVGAGKCGTTSLHEYLKLLPDVYMSPIKEPHFFSETVLSLNNSWKNEPLRDEATYFALFDGVVNEKIIGESSTTYQFDPKAPNLIYQMNPKAKIIMILRDPVERTFSNWLHLKRPHFTRYHKFLKPSFYEQIQFTLNEKIDYNVPHLRLYMGNYSQYLKKYYDVFGKEQVLVLIFEDFVKDLKTSMKNVCDFLEIKNYSSIFNNQIHNPYIGPKGKISNYLLTNNTFKNIARKFFVNVKQKNRVKKLLTTTKKPTMTSKEREFLKNYFFDDVRELELLLNKKLPWKNFTS